MPTNQVNVDMLVITTHLNIVFNTERCESG